MARMPLITRIAGLAGVAFAVALHSLPAAAQLPPRPLEQSQRSAAMPPASWAGGNPQPGEPQRLVHTAYQAPAPVGNVQAGPQQPLPLAPPQNGAAGAGNPDVKPLVTGAASLGLVLGLFLLVVWSVRRGMPKGAGLLPAEAVEVLGRAPIAGRQHVHLVRCGNKLVLLSASGAGVETLTEISDPGEVARLQEICRHTTTPASALRQLLGRVSAPPAAMGRAELDRDLDFDHLQAAGFRRA